MLCLAPGYLLGLLPSLPAAVASKSVTKRAKFEISYFFENSEIFSR